MSSLDVDSDYVELAVELFSMLADPTRVRIILALRDEELPVSRLAEIVDKPRQRSRSTSPSCGSPGSC